MIFLRNMRDPNIIGSSIARDPSKPGTSGVSYNLKTNFLLSVSQSEHVRGGQDLVQRTHPGRRQPDHHRLRPQDPCPE